MTNSQIGLDQVGGVTQAAKGQVDNADSRVQAAKAIQQISEGTHGLMQSPGANLMREGMDAHAVASSKSGIHGAEVAKNRSLGERDIVQASEDSAQVQKVSATGAMDIMHKMNPPMEA